MKHVRFYVLVGLLVLLLTAIPFPALVNPPELRKPQSPVPENPDEAVREETIYRDDRHTVSAHGDVLIIRNRKTGERYRMDAEGDRVAEVQRIRNKAAEETPLLGTELADGLKLTGASRIHIVQTAPTVKLVAVYPHPHSSEDKIIIDKTSNTLFFYQRGEPAKQYRVATGKQPEYTPEGTFSIVKKTPLPWGNGPETIYGPRWMGLAVPCEKDRRRAHDARAPRGDKYGIHGTNEPESIGTYASGGCIRLKNEDIVELYELVEVGTTVQIIP